VLTHGHEDHIGALSYLLREFNVPVYGTPLTLAIARHRLGELGALESADLRPYAPGDEIRAGGFVVIPIRVTHSIADGIGLAIETPVGTIIHTGDFKLDPRPVDAEQPDYAKFAALGERGVLCLCSDSTNVGRPGRTGSETEVGEALQGRFAKAPGRILVATFASHIHRIQQVLSLAQACGRKVALLGRSMVANVAVASEMGYLKVPEGLVSTDAYPYLEYQTPKGNVVPPDFVLDPYFFVRLRPQVLPPDLAIRNLSDPEDQDYVLGLAYEDREDYIAAADHLSKIKGKKQACAQAEIAWMKTRQDQPKSPGPVKSRNGWEPCH